MALLRPLRASNVSALINNVTKRAASSSRNGSFARSLTTKITATGSAITRSTPHLAKLASYGRSLHTTGSMRYATPASPHVTEPASLTTDQYHKLSDAYIDCLVAELEELQEENEQVDVEYSSGVLTLAFPPAGTYVLNKQPPNRQIWLSSPISGPKRYDFVCSEGLNEGQWVYLRDGSKLTELLREELGIKLEEL